MKYFHVYIKPYLKKYAHWLSLAILFGVLTAVGSTMLTFTSGYLISSASLMPYNILMLYVPIVLVRTFGISQAVTRYIERLIGHDAALKILADMRVRLYKMLEPQALFVRSRFQTGDLLGTLADDIEHLQDVYIRTILPTIVALFLFIASIIALALFDWKFALWIGLCLSIIVFIYPIVSLFLVKRAQLNLKEAQSRQYSILTDAVFGMNDWIISGRSFVGPFMKDSKETTFAERKLRHWNQSRELQIRVLSGLVLITVGIWSGLEAQSGTIAPTYIAAFTLVTLPLIESLIPVSHAIEKIPTYKESLNRIGKIEGFVEHKKKPNIPIDKTGDINIDNLFFRYEGSKENVLRNITLNIPYGHKLALLGRSGAGKSTLLQILLGELLPTDGKVSINGYSPQNYSDNVFEMISVLNQKPYLFATSVENNIRLGNQTATKDEIDRVMKQVKLDRYIHSLPNGILTQMEETGARFSGGERQRIALARILLKDTPIVILDEPTVGLDPQTEADLIETIFDSLKEKTVIWITHHLMGMENMDQIVFMEKGKVILNGNHQELMRDNDRYRNLYMMDKGDI